MKISEKTVDVLKNFATINSSIAFKEGNKIRTVSEQKNILAQAIVPETFPRDFAIYELNQLLGLVSLFEDADIEFAEKNLTVSEGKNNARYTYTDQSMVTQPPEKNIELPSEDVSFDMTKEQLTKVMNAANQLALPEVVVRGDGSTVKLVATDSKNPTSNEFAVEVGSTTNTFNFIFKVENLKMVPANYQVAISAKGISQFKGAVAQYWIATEAGSSFNG